MVHKDGVNQSVRTEIEIAATPERVWEVLTDLAAYPDWNPVMRWLKGDARLGGAIRFRIEIGGLPPLTLAAKICAYEPQRELAWRGGPPSVFSGMHYLRLTPLEGGRTRLVHGEDFRGVLVRGLFRRWVMPRIVRSYDEMNRANRRAIDRRSSHRPNRRALCRVTTGAPDRTRARKDTTT